MCFESPVASIPHASGKQKGLRHPAGSGGERTLAGHPGAVKSRAGIPPAEKIVRTAIRSAQDFSWPCVYCVDAGPRPFKSEQFERDHNAMESSWNRGGNQGEQYPSELLLFPFRALCVSFLFFRYVPGQYPVDRLSEFSANCQKYGRTWFLLSVF